jgi:hypothetical protein
MDFSVDPPEEATKGLWNGSSGQGQLTFFALAFGLFVNTRLIIWKTIGEPAGARLGKAP